MNVQIQKNARLTHFIPISCFHSPGEYKKHWPEMCSFARYARTKQQRYQCNFMWRCFTVLFVNFSQIQEIKLFSLLILNKMFNILYKYQRSSFWVVCSLAVIVFCFSKQLRFSKSRIETIEKSVKYVQRYQQYWIYQSDIIDVFLVSLLLTLNLFLTFFQRFY